MAYSCCKRDSSCSAYRRRDVVMFLGHSVRTFVT